MKLLVVIMKLLDSTFGYTDLNYISYHSPRRLK